MNNHPPYPFDPSEEEGEYDPRPECCTEGCSNRAEVLGECCEECYRKYVEPEETEQP